MLAEFERAGAAIAPVYDAAQVIADPHIQFRESITAVPDPELGLLEMQNVLARLSATPGSIRWAGRSKGADFERLRAAEII